MRRAVDAAKKSIPETGRKRPPPKVGAVLVKNGELVAESFRGEHRAGDHAEYVLLSKALDRDLVGASVYTTLEPCSQRNPGKIACALRLIQSGITTVYIGMYDPNPVIYRAGWRLLRDAGVDLRDFDAALREEIISDNAEFTDIFRRGMGAEGDAVFDYLQNDGRFDIDGEDVVFRTNWTMAGKRAIYAYDSERHVAHARFATSFDEVDDPGSLDFASHSRRIGEGEIAVFRNEAGFALVRVDKVLSGPEYGDSHTEVQIHWQLRVA